MGTMTTPASGPRPEVGHRDGPTPRHEQIASYLAIAALALVAVKPLFDIGEKKGSSGIDLGVVLTAVGAVLMIAAYGLVALGARRLPPRPLLVVAGAVVLLLVSSAVSFLLVGARADLLDLFDVRRYPIYGAHLEPRSAIPAEAMRLVVGFAPIALLGLMLMRRSLLSSRRLVLVTGVILLGAIVHCVLAWLQVAGVIPYSFYFELANWQKIGRASGGYYHPMSLGRLLIFSVFLIYVLGDRLRISAAVRYALIVLFVATGAVSLHRFTILCLIVIVAAFEARRVRDLVASRRAGRRIDRRPTLLVGGAVVAVAAVAGGLWGGAIWERVRVALTEVGSLDVRSDTFMHGRGAIWNDVADILGRSSADVWLFGFGYEPWDMHNDLIRIMVIWGITGLVLVGAILVGSYRLARAQVGTAGRLPLLVLFATLLIFGLTQKPLGYPYFLWLFFLGVLAVLAVDAETDDAGTDDGVRAEPSVRSGDGDPVAAGGPT